MEFHSKNLNTMWGSSDKVSLSKNKTGKACYKLTNMYHITKGSEVLIVCNLLSFYPQHFYFTEGKLIIKYVNII